MVPAAVYPSGGRRKINRILATWGPRRLAHGDSADIVRRQLVTTDARWAELEPHVRAILLAQQTLRGEGPVTENPVAWANVELWLALEQPQGPADQVPEKLSALREDPRRRPNHPSRRTRRGSEAVASPEQRARLVILGVRR